MVLETLNGRIMNLFPTDHLECFRHVISKKKNTQKPNAKRPVKKFSPQTYYINKYVCIYITTIIIITTKIIKRDFVRALRTAPLSFSLVTASDYRTENDKIITPFPNALSFETNFFSSNTTFPRGTRPAFPELWIVRVRPKAQRLLSEIHACRRNRRENVKLTANK